MTATATYTAGDIVTGRPVKNGEPQATSRGIVLGLFGTDPTCGYLVWWYGKGDASMQTTSLMFPRELKPAAATLDGLSEKVLRRIERGASRFDGARQVHMKAGTLRARKRSARLAA
ncbi:DUF6409 family protein [Streptomyces sp. TRM68367]|uniref:DUF6409 family protein n=1 Tax=Streptomyces sp. TRM68367 TaxID=2758415 RepID=UPI00165C313C|nr:DUF6409 family protein [Streptomyces sp. TRM68367]MBC9730702.1 hypothetical protein [Streptomyces sp. TRM68367]